METFLRVLSEDEKTQVHERSLKILSETGVKVNTDLVSIHPTYNRRMTSQLIVDKQSKQQHNLSDTRICSI